MGDIVDLAQYIGWWGHWLVVLPEKAERHTKWVRNLTYGFDNYVRPGHNSGGPQQGFDTLTKRFVMFELVKQDQLIKQNSAQNNQLGALQAFDRDLPTPFEDIFEQTIEGFNSLMAQDMKNAAYINTGIMMRIGSSTGADEQTITQLTPGL